MDERKISRLFQDAVGDVPPPSFDVHDVTVESDRQRVRRRNGLVVGSTLAVVLLGGTAFGVALWNGWGAQEAPAAGIASDDRENGNGRLAPNEVPNEETERSPGTASGVPRIDVPSGSSKQGGESGGDAGPQSSGGTPSGCEQADRKLAGALAGELPAAAPPTPSPAAISCPEGSRGASLTLTEQTPDGEVSGVVSIVLTRPGVRWTDPAEGEPPGTEVGSAGTDEGRLLVVVSEPTNGSAAAPYADRMQAIADELAKRDWY